MIELTTNINADEELFNWSSSDESIAVVVNGKVVGMKEGIVTISVAYSEQVATYTVTVIPMTVNITLTGSNVLELGSTDNGIKAVASDITLNGFDDDIMLIIRGYEGGGFVCRAVFDKIEKTPHALDLLNTFNDNSAFFKAFIREDGYLELYHFFVCYDVKVYKEYGSEFLCRAADLNKDDAMVELASLTKQND